MNQTETTPSIFQRGIYALLDSITIASYSFIYVIIVVRSIPKEEYGVLVLCDSIRIFLVLFSDLALGQALIKYAAEKDKQELPAVLTHSILLKLGLTGLASLGLWLFSGIIAELFHVPRLAVLLRWVPLLLFAIMLNNFARQLLTAKQKLNRVFWIDVMVLVSFLSFFTLFKVTGNLTNGVQVIWTVALSYFICAFPGLWFARDYLKFQTRVQRVWFVQLSRFASYSFMNSAGVQIYSKIDLFMLAYFASPLNVAVYNVAHLFTNFVAVINDSMNALVFPATAKIDLTAGESSRNRIRKIYETSTGILFLLAIPITVTLFLFPEFILRIIYGGKYQDAAALVRIFAFWGLLHPFYRIAASIFNGIGKPELNARLTWLGAGINVTLNLGLIPLLGALGAAITALVTTAVILVVYLILLRKQFAIRPLVIDFEYLNSLLKRR
ncbi:MAG: flippase [bacterium]|nr:flippase [bacterium]